MADPDAGDVVRYWFRATPSPDAETGAKFDSGWFAPGDARFPACPTTGSTCGYTVPPGSLADGVTYSWHVWTWDTAVAWVKPDWVRSFIVDLHLGAGDALPTDALGPVQVNLASGNAVVGASSPGFAAVGGPVGLTYTYNSRAPRADAGLLGSYFVHGGGVPAPPLAGDTPVVARVDPAVNFTWLGANPLPSVPGTNFMARWEGWLTVPAGATTEYRFGLSSDDGVRMWVDGNLVVDAWGAQSDWLSANSGPLALAGGSRHAVRIEYFQGGGASWVDLVYRTGADGLGERTSVPAGWLSHDTAGLPQGWTLAPAGASYAAAAQFQGGVVLTGPTGAARTYPWSGPGAGFVPDASDDAVVATDTSGRVSVHGEGARTHVFDAWGGLTSASGPTDDGNATALAYGWSAPGSGAHRLVSVTDPYSDRTVALRHGGRDACPALAGHDPAPADMLCQVAWWDATTSDLFYKGGRLARMVGPGGATTDFGYDAGGRMTAVRSPLQADAVAAGALTGAPDDDTSRTALAHDGDGRVTSVALAGPPDARPAHSYDYADLAQRHVKVHVAGLGEPLGFATDLRWGADADPWVADATGTAYVRPPGAPGEVTVVATDATNLTTTAVADWGDRPTSGTDATGRTATATYDVGAPPDPALRLTGMPVGTKGSGATATRSETALAWDGGPAGAWGGLAGTWWANTGLAGAPRAHARHDGPDLVATVPAGAGGEHSARFSGDIELPAGPTPFKLRLADHGRLFVDDTMVVDAWSPHPTTVEVAGGSVTGPGRRRVRVDYSSLSATTPRLEVLWGAASAPVPSTSLAPRYSDLTSTFVAGEHRGPHRPTGRHRLRLRGVLPALGRLPRPPGPRPDHGDDLRRPGPPGRPDLARGHRHHLRPLRRHRRGGRRRLEHLRGLRAPGRRPALGDRPRPRRRRTGHRPVPPVRPRRGGPGARVPGGRRRLDLHRL